LALTGAITAFMASGISFAHIQARQSLSKSMKSKKLKLVVILAWVIFAGWLLSTVKHASAISEEGDASIPPMPNVSQNESPGLQTGLMSGPVSGRDMFYKMLLSAVIVITLGIGAIYATKKLLPRITNLPNKKIKVIETTHLAPRKGLHLIQVGTRQLLIASTNDNITMLADVTELDSDFASQLAARS
jgi:flagellar biogenesis protein FliO